MIPPSELEKIVNLGNPLVWIGAVGTAFWLVAYALVLIRDRKLKTYSIPLMAIALNFTWEAIFTLFKPDPVTLWELMNASWLVVDIFIIMGLLRYGRAVQVIPEMKQYFMWFVGGAFALGFAMQYTFAQSFDDDLGIVVAFLINVVMSIVFVFMYLVRREHDRLQLWIAITKALGTLPMSIMCFVLMPEIYPERANWSFMHVMYVAITIIDVVYIAMLVRGGKRAAIEASARRTAAVDPNPTPAGA